MLPTKTKLKLTPKHQGRRMSLEAFERAECEDGYFFELARGVLVVAEIPNMFHAFVVAFIRNQLLAYKLRHPTEIYEVLSTMECKVVIQGLKSDRHPDLAVYKSAPVRRKGRKAWNAWIPDILIEVVSESSADRDYVEKRDEYLALGVREYWIVDPLREQVLVLRRQRGQWSETVLHAEDVLETKLLPGFRVSCGEIFAAGQEE